jgi:hypothetical protein
MTLFTINGRNYYFNYLNSLVQVGPGNFTVNRHSTQYEIFGGKKAGGRRNEWYLTKKEWASPIPCNSLVDALTVLEKM